MKKFLVLLLILMLCLTGCQPVTPPAPSPSPMAEEPESAVIIQSGETRLAPPLYLAWEHCYTELGWLMADMANVLSELPNVKLPVLIYEAKPIIHTKKNISLVSVRIFDDSFTEIEHRSADLSHTEMLPEGSYTILLTLKEQGRYIEADHDFEEKGYQCAFILKKGK